MHIIALMFSPPYHYELTSLRGPDEMSEGGVWKCVRALCVVSLQNIDVTLALIFSIWCVSPFPGGHWRRPCQRDYVSRGRG